MDGLLKLHHLHKGIPPNISLNLTIFPLFSLFLITLKHIVSNYGKVISDRIVLQECQCIYKGENANTNLVITF